VAAASPVTSGRRVLSPYRTVTHDPQRGFVVRVAGRGYDVATGHNHGTGGPFVLVVICALVHVRS
jgi:hypothetical protein